MGLVPLLISEPSEPVICVLSIAPTMRPGLICCQRLICDYIVGVSCLSVPTFALPTVQSIHDVPAHRSRTSTCQRTHEIIEAMPAESCPGPEQATEDHFSRAELILSPPSHASQLHADYLLEDVYLYEGGQYFTQNRGE